MHVHVHVSIYICAHLYGHAYTARVRTYAHDAPRAQPFCMGVAARWVSPFTSPFVGRPRAANRNRPTKGGRRTTGGGSWWTPRYRGYRPSLGEGLPSPPPSTGSRGFTHPPWKTVNVASTSLLRRFKTTSRRQRHNIITSRLYQRASRRVKRRSWPQLGHLKKSKSVIFIMKELIFDISTISC